MLTLNLLALGLAIGASAQSINPATIEVPAPSTVFALPVIYASTSGAQPATGTTLAPSASATSDPSATNVFSNAAQASAAVAQQLRRRTLDGTVCVPQPLLISHVSDPDTPGGFVADTYYASQALSAATPSGYTDTFSNLNASNSAQEYMGYTLLSSYDVNSCTNQCSAISGCNAVNIYFERDPTVNPNSDCCANPPSTVNIKCVFWGDAITVANANNFGQWRNQFEVLVAGSNGYVNTTYLNPSTSSPSSTSSATSSSTSSAPQCTNTYPVDANGPIQVFSWATPTTSTPNGFQGQADSITNGTSFSIADPPYMVNSNFSTCGNALAFDPTQQDTPQQAVFAPLGTDGLVFPTCWVRSWSDFLITCSTPDSGDWTAQVCESDGYETLRWAPGDAQDGCQWVGLYYHTPNNPNAPS